MLAWTAPWHPPLTSTLPRIVLRVVGLVLVLVGVVAWVGPWPEGLLRPSQPGWLVALGVLALGLGAPWRSAPRPLTFHIVRMWGTGVTESGAALSLATFRPLAAGPEFERLRDGIVRAGSSAEEADAFASAWVATQRVRERGVPWPGTGHLEAIEVLARATLRDTEHTGAVGGRAWRYGVLVRPDGTSTLCSTPEQARVVARDVPEGSVLYLAGYCTLHEPILARQLPLVGLGLAPFDPFDRLARSCAHHGGPLAGLDVSGDLGRVVASLGNRGRQRIAEVGDDDRSAVPEVDECLLQPGPISAREWPRHLAALLLYRSLAGPPSDLAERAHGVLRGWRARGDNDGAWVNFWAAWRHLATQPASGDLWATDWPDDLADAVPTKPVRP
jgi:hypothetical protein